LPRFPLPPFRRKNPQKKYFAEIPTPAFSKKKSAEEIFCRAHKFSPASVNCQVTHHNFSCLSIFLTPLQEYRRALKQPLSVHWHPPKLSLQHKNLFLTNMAKTINTNHRENLRNTDSDMSESECEDTVNQCAEAAAEPRATSLEETTTAKNVLNSVSKGTVLALDGVTYSHVILEGVTDILSRPTEWLDDTCLEIWMKHLENKKKNKKHKDELEIICVGP